MTGSTTTTPTDLPLLRTRQEVSTAVHHLLRAKQYRQEHPRLTGIVKALHSTPTWPPPTSTIRTRHTTRKTTLHTRRRRRAHRQTRQRRQLACHRRQRGATAQTTPSIWYNQPRLHPPSHTKPLSGALRHLTGLTQGRIPSYAISDPIPLEDPVARPVRAPVTTVLANAPPRARQPLQVPGQHGG